MNPYLDNTAASAFIDVDIDDIEQKIFGGFRSSNMASCLFCSIDISRLSLHPCMTYAHRLHELEHSLTASIVLCHGCKVICVLSAASVGLRARTPSTMRKPRQGSQSFDSSIMFRCSGTMKASKLQRLEHQ